MKIIKAILGVLCAACLVLSCIAWGLYGVPLFTNGNILVTSLLSFVGGGLIGIIWSNILFKIILKL
jgi:hypothetical protein